MAVKKQKSPVFQCLETGLESGEGVFFSLLKLKV